MPSNNDLSASMQHAQARWYDGDVAERYANAENATRPFAKMMVERSGLEQQLDKDVHIFDLATGTGAAIQELYDAVPKEQWGHLKVLGGDVSASMIEYLKRRGEAQGWTGLSVQVVDGNNLAFPPESFTHIFCTFAIFVLPSCLPTLFSLLKPGGFIGITTWSSLPWQSLLDTCIPKIRGQPYLPSAAEVKNKMFSGRDWDKRDYVASQLEGAGFERVETDVAERRAQVGSPKMFMEGMQFPLMIVKTFWEESKREEWLKELNELIYKEIVDQAGGEDHPVGMDFGGIIAWGWKKE